MLFVLFALGLLSVVLGAKKKSPCEFEVAKIALQPQSCAYNYLERAARQVHNPKYRWFTDNIEAVVSQFYGDNFVAVEATNAFGYGFAYVGSTGELSTAYFTPYDSYDMMRTMGIGLKTKSRSEYTEDGNLLQEYYITQQVWGPLGQLLMITVSLPLQDFINIP
jgi:hypothetical protein